MSYSRRKSEVHRMSMMSRTYVWHTYQMSLIARTYVWHTYQMSMIARTYVWHTYQMSMIARMLGSDTVSCSGRQSRRK